MHTSQPDDAKTLTAAAEATRPSARNVPYAWVILGACLFVIVLGYGVQYSFGVFFKALQDEFGWSRGTTSGIFTLYQVFHCLFALFAGWATDRFGPRVVVAGGGVLIGGALLLTGGANALWQIYLSYGVMLGIGISVAYTPLMATVSRWFTSRRGLALGILTAGMGLGTVIMAPLAGYLVSDFGWRLSYTFIGAAVIVIYFLASILLRESPMAGPFSAMASWGKRAPSLPRPSSGAASQVNVLSIGEALRTPSLLVLAAMFGLAGFGLFMVMTHVVRYAQDLGISTVAATSVLATIGAASVAGKVFGGYVSDHIGRRRILWGSMVLMAAAIMWLVKVGDLLWLYVFAVIFGMAYGGWAAMFPAIAGDLFGVARLGIVMGLVQVGGGLGSAVGPLVAGYTYDATGSYAIAFGVGALACLVGVALMPLVRVQKKVQTGEKA